MELSVTVFFFSVQISNTFAAWRSSQISVDVLKCNFYTFPWSQNYLKLFMLWMSMSCILALVFNIMRLSKNNLKKVVLWLMAKSFFQYLRTIYQSAKLFYVNWCGSLPVINSYSMMLPHCCLLLLFINPLLISYSCSILSYPYSCV